MQYYYVSVEYKYSTNSIEWTCYRKPYKKAYSEENVVALQQTKQ